MYDRKLPRRLEGHRAIAEPTCPDTTLTMLEDSREEKAGKLKRPIILFSGQRVDWRGRWGWFSKETEEIIRAAVRERLMDFQTTIGFSSARAGLDVIFGEELLSLGGELTLCLPCVRDDFVAQYIEPAGDEWARRFDLLCAGATEVIISCEERLLGDETLLRFNNQMLQGLARLRARALGVAPGLLAAWSVEAPPEAGSPAELIDAWPELSTLSLIDLDELRAADDNPDSAQCAPDAVDDPSEFAPSPRAVRAILFADIASFTRFDDFEVPLVFDFLAEAQARLDDGAPKPLLLNSWGDAVHAAAVEAHALAEYALALSASVEAIDPAFFGLSRRPRFRIALHAGPVFAGLHPLTGRSMIFGHHVNRAARLEPLAQPGSVLASRHFVALLLAEDAARADVARQEGRAYASSLSLRHKGRVTLPKSFGSEDVYSVLPVVTADVVTADVVQGDRVNMVRDGTHGPEPTSQPRRIEIAFPPELEQLPDLALRIEAFAALHGLDDAVVHAVNLAVDELVTNAILHGGLGDAASLDAPIRVSVAVDDGALSVRLRDRGRPFDPTALAEPDLDADVDDRPIGGLGVHFVRTLMDDFTYRRHEGENEVFLLKRPRSASDEAGSMTERKDDDGNSRTT